MAEDRRRSRSPERLALEAAVRWRDDVVLVVEHQSWHQLALLARRALRLQISKVVVQTGVGRLVADRTLWRHSTSETCESIRAVCKNWREVNRGEDFEELSGGWWPRRPGTVHPARPLGGMKVDDFTETVKRLEFELENLVPHETSVGYRDAASATALRCLRSASDLEGLFACDTDAWASRPLARVILAKAVGAANCIAKRRQARALRQASLPEAVSLSGGELTTKSAGERVGALAVLNVESSLQRVADLFSEVGVPGFGSVLTPAATPSALRAAGAQGLDVVQALEQRAEVLIKSARLRSLQGAASALRARHGFATLILGYDSRSTLPPRSGQDVVLRGATFKSAGAAANSVFFLRWTCVSEGLDSTWHTQPGVLLAGLKKVTLEQVATRLKIKRLLDSRKVEQMVTVSTLVGSEPGWPELLLFGWNFLCRMQSEALLAEWGSAEDVLKLPAQRHSAVFIPENGAEVVFRMARRKNRPQGSLLRRPCTCSMAQDLCLSHRLRLAPGQRLFGFTQSDATRKLRRGLGIIKVVKVVSRGQGHGDGGASVYVGSDLRRWRMEEQGSLQLHRRRYG